MKNILVFINNDKHIHEIVNMDKINGNYLNLEISSAISLSQYFRILDNITLEGSNINNNDRTIVLITGLGDCLDSYRNDELKSEVLSYKIFKGLLESINNVYDIFILNKQGDTDELIKELDLIECVIVTTKEEDITALITNI